MILYVCVYVYISLSLYLSLSLYIYIYICIIQGGLTVISTTYISETSLETKNNTRNGNR